MLCCCVATCMFGEERSKGLDLCMHGHARAPVVPAIFTSYKPWLEIFITYHMNGTKERPKSKGRFHA
jgi:hypothetical protein